jgi:GntR family transcriptional regulator
MLAPIHRDSPRRGVTLNPADPKPLYTQLAAVLRAQIYSGELTVGQQVPTEDTLTETHSVGRNTVRLALALLRTEGLIESRRGRGSFVRAQNPLRYYATLSGSRRHRLTAQRNLDTFGQQVTAQGKVPKQVSTTEVITAHETLAAQLNLQVGDLVGVRHRVMYADETPIQLGDSYYPHNIVIGTPIMANDDVTAGTDQILEDLGHTPTRYEDEITWRMPTADEKTKLHLAPGTPVARLQRLTFDQHEERVEMYVAILPGDRHILIYDVDAE